MKNLQTQIESLDFFPAYHAAIDVINYVLYRHNPRAYSAMKGKLRKNTFACDFLDAGVSFDCIMSLLLMRLDATKGDAPGCLKGRDDVALFYKQTCQETGLNHEAAA